MDSGRDLEMPSPKRMRVEESSGAFSNDLPMQLDHVNGSQGAPTCAAVSSMTSEIDAPKGLLALPSSAISKPFHLPGLKLPNDEPSLSSGDQEQTADSKEIKEIKTLDRISRNGERQFGTVSLGNGNISGLYGEGGIPSGQPILGPTGELSLTDCVPMVSPPQGNSKPTEDEAVEAVISQKQVLEEMSEPPLDTKLQEATILAPDALIQTGVQENSLPENGKIPARDTDRSTHVEGQRDEVEEKMVIEGADDSKQEHVSEPGIVKTIPESAEPPTLTFAEVAEANKADVGAEYEMDSSPYQSSLSDTSTDTSSSDDSGDDHDADDYEMLSPEEEARRLMAEDGAAEEKTTASVPRTLNEKPDEVVPKPQVSVTTDMKIEELGRVENLVENLVLIKANTSGEYQVLETGSVLCLEDRSVIGAIAETLGRVQQPYYSVRFSNAAAIEEARISQNTKVFYVTRHSTTVFTQPLKAYKGSDASNLHDEEVGDDELEFSDDEAEAEHRRQVKLQKRARYDAKHDHGNGVLNVSQPRPGAPETRPNGRSNAWPERPPNPEALSLNYDDAGEDSDGLYTPLARPSNFYELMAPKDLSSNTHANRGNAIRGGRGKGRGDRGGGRGGRGRGNDRGKSDRRDQNSFRGNGRLHAQPNTGQQSSPTSQTNGFNTSTSNALPPRPPPQSSSSHSHAQTQHLPMQPPSYPVDPSLQPHLHPSYAPHNQRSYNQPYPQQHQQPQYQYHDPHMQGISYQGHFPQQAFSQGLTYPIQQIPPTPAAIPPGAHINPNFFRQQAQSSPQPWYPQYRQASTPPQQYQQYQQPPLFNSNAGATGGTSPDASRRLREDPNMLKGMGPNGGSHG